MMKTIQLQVSPEESSSNKQLKVIVANIVSKDPSDISHIEIIKRSIDARQKIIKINLKIDVYINEKFKKNPELKFNFKNTKKKSAVIIGAGPAGLFAALRLIEKGIKPIIFERGKDVKNRRRDIAFVIDDKLILSNILSDRKEELKAIDHLLSFIAPEKIISLSDSARIEGGDVILYNDYVFIGYSEESDFNDFTVARTNKEGVIQIQKKFPNKKVKSFELVKSDTVAKNNSLHLDCCFQPIGKNKAIIYEGGFKNIADIKYLNKLFGANNLIKINQDEMYEMNSNIFSISENVIVSEKNFIRLNQALINHGFLVEEIAFSEISKMEGLLRCSTMPLIRI